MKVTSVLAVAFAALASASPLGLLGKQTGSQKLATFDDLPAVPAVSQLNPVGTYSTNTTPNMPLPPPHPLTQSPQRASNTTASTSSSRASPASNSQASPPNPASTSPPTASPATSSPAPRPLSPAKPYNTLDLQSLYFACVVNSVESAAGVPQQCTIAFTAYKKGSQSPFQTINKQFNPTNAVLSKMAKATFPRSWEGVERVDIAIVQSTTGASLSGLLIDDVAYKLNK